MGGEGWKEKQKGWRFQKEISFGVNLKRLEEMTIESLIRGSKGSIWIELIVAETEN